MRSTDWFSFHATIDPVDTADALQAALADPAQRWYGLRRVHALAAAGALTAASSVEPAAPPEGKDGKFIETFGWVRWFHPGTMKWRTGWVSDINAERRDDHRPSDRRREGRVPRRQEPVLPAETEGDARPSRPGQRDGPRQVQEGRRAGRLQPGWPLPGRRVVRRPVAGHLEALEDVLGAASSSGSRARKPISARTPAWAATPVRCSTRPSMS